MSILCCLIWFILLNQSNYGDNIKKTYDNTLNGYIRITNSNGITNITGIKKKTKKVKNKIYQFNKTGFELINCYDKTFDINKDIKKKDDRNRFHLIKNTPLLMIYLTLLRTNPALTLFIFITHNLVTQVSGADNGHVWQKRFGRDKYEDTRKIQRNNNNNNNDNRANNGVEGGDRGNNNNNINKDNINDNNLANNGGEGNIGNNGNNRDNIDNPGNYNYDNDSDTCSDSDDNKPILDSFKKKKKIKKRKTKRKRKRKRKMKKRKKKKKKKKRSRSRSRRRSRNRNRSTSSDNRQPTTESKKCGKKVIVFNNRGKSIKNIGNKFDL